MACKFIYLQSYVVPLIYKSQKARPAYSVVILRIVEKVFYIFFGRFVLIKEYVDVQTLSLDQNLRNSDVQVILSH